MQDIVSPLLNLSYTNKDFLRIYPELLDLVKELTNKWDPSISNESDPGVILIKLNALIADKCNYNIDKNVLECFPLSVTQTKNARLLFDLLGYYMRWYRSASVFVSMKWIGDLADGITYTIPAFTMITDETKSVVYTLVGYVPITNNEEFTVSDIVIPANGKTINTKAIQGVAIKYDINGDTVITPNHLDQDNRLYFNVSNIAENGIFITNVGTSNYSSWVRKDNLLVEDFGNTYYKFGVTADGSTCYLEFPEDVDNLMKDGIEITYIRSDGENGTIMASLLNNFYADVTVSSSLDTSVVINALNVLLTNYFASTTGLNYESIDEAYKNYKRSIGTFSTLITLRDYINYILSNNLASNGFCSDRRTDIQLTYGIMSYNNGVDSITTVIEPNNNNQPSLTAFSLKLYLLKYFSNISTSNLYNSSFLMMTDSLLLNVEDYIADVKSLQHDYEPILETDSNRSHFCFFKNRYPLSCTIIPQYKLSYTQEAEVKLNVQEALYKALNSKEIDFSEKISTDYLYKVISDADERIKNIILDSINYQTYAVYLENGIYKELLVSGDIDDNCEISALHSNDTPVTAFTASINSSTYINKMISDQLYGYDKKVFTYNNGNWKFGGNNVTLSNYGITVTGSTPTTGDKLEVIVSKQTQFRDEILAKSILAGVTPFFVLDELFDYRMDESSSIIYDNIQSISSNVSITLNNSNSSYVLRNNEEVEFFAPNLLEQAVYNNYVKFESHLNSIIGANQYHELQQDEYVVFYWKSSSSAAEYSFAAYGQGCILMPTFNLGTTISSTSTTADIVAELNLQVVPKVVTTQDFSLNAYQSLEIASLTATENILSSDKSVSHFIINKLSLNTYCYWVLNKITISDNIETYLLFDVGESEYILKSGEYFFYTDNEMNSFVSLGAGTKISRTTTSDICAVRALDIASITLNGLSALQSYWYSPSYFFDIEELQYIHLTEGYTIRIAPKQTQTWLIVISKTGSTVTASSATVLADFDIYYKSNSSMAEEQKIPEYDFSTSAAWDAKSLLNINSSITDEQILLSGLSITLTTISSSVTINGGNITGTSPSAVYYPTVFKTSNTINFSGEGEHDTIEFDSMLNPIYMKLYKYSKLITRSAIVKYVGDNASILILSGSSSSNTTNPPIFSLPAGNYILPIVIPDLPDNTYMTIQYKDITASSALTYLHPIYDNTLNKLNEGTLYPMYFSVPTTGHNYSLVVKLVDSSLNPVSSTTNISLTIKNPYRFEASPKLSKILYLIKMFDLENIFDYTYIANSNETVSDPLTANSFLNTNHIYNKYTICLLETESLTNLLVNY